MRRPIGRLASLVASATLAVACATGPPSDAIEIVLPPPADTDLRIEPLTVVVRAPVGVLNGVGVGDPAGAAGLPDTSVRAVPGRPNALLLDWLGGACDARVEILLEPVGDGLRVTGKTDTGFATSCPAVGIPRAIELDLAQPVDPTQVAFDQGP